MIDRAAAGRVERIGRERIRRPPLSERAPIRHVDPALVITAVSLAAFGVLMVYSATGPRLTADGLPRNLFLVRQVAFAVVAVVLMVLVAAFRYQRLKAWGPTFYVAMLVLLGIVLSPLGTRTAGAQRWISFGAFQLQPSELVKVAVIVVLASLLAGGRGDPSPITVARALAVVAVPALLIFAQPDLGTIMVLVAIAAGMLLVAGIRIRFLLALLLVGALAFYGAVQLGVLEDYQVARLTAFLDPASDPQRTGYNLNQAKIAVGSGQLLGKGLFAGTQTNLDFVPEVHTDFIFTAVGEELGFVGAAGLLGLFAVFLWRGIRIAMLSKDPFGSLLAAGVVSMVAVQVFVNIGMTIGVMPITGIPLPFVSYGGSSLVTTFVATGILLNIHMRRML